MAFPAAQFSTLHNAHFSLAATQAEVRRPKSSSHTCSHKKSHYTPLAYLSLFRSVGYQTKKGFHCKRMARLLTLDSTTECKTWLQDFILAVRFRLQSKCPITAVSYWNWGSEVKHSKYSSGFYWQISAFLKLFMPQKSCGSEMSPSNTTERFCFFSLSHTFYYCFFPVALWLDNHIIRNGWSFSTLFHLFLEIVGKVAQ